jgi:exodeoxyribonuclease VII large subunit
VRAPTPTAAARLVVPDLDELRAGLGRARQRLDAGAQRTLERDQGRLVRSRERLTAAPGLFFERRRAALDRAAARLQALSPRATLARGYAIVRSADGVLRDAAAVAEGGRIDVELARGALGARVEEVRP